MHAVNTTPTETSEERVCNADSPATGGLAGVGDYPDFETLIERISSQLADITWETDAVVDLILTQLGSFLGADRIGYLEVDTDKGTLMPTTRWFAEGVDTDELGRDANVSGLFRWLTARIVAGECVAIDDLDQFPDSASNERSYCEKLGIQSFAMVPAELAGKVVAALAIDSIRQPRDWDKALIERLKLVAEIVAGSIRRVSLQRSMAELRSFELAAFQLSTKFVNLRAEQIDAEIEEGLGIVAKALGVPLVSMLEPEGRNDFRVTHEWAQQNGVRFKGVTVLGRFPWLAAKLVQGKSLAITELSDFPPEAEAEIAAMRQVGFQAVLWVPFKARGKLAGYLCIDSRDSRSWSDDLVARLKLLGEVFGEAAARRDAEHELQESYRQIQKLKKQLKDENVYLRREFKLDFHHGSIVGNSEQLRLALRKVEQVAETDTTVLITGETGTGKELLARAIHNLSPRRDNLMVTVNCAALPSSLVEAELFGREKGAYTGALTREAGRFEVANGSTILLDEIGELPLELQAKLLRVLETGEFQRLGSSKTQKVDVRVLASTNRDLAAAVREKEFREDLFFRLNVFQIEVPPLRERTDDIPKLVWSFVQEFSKSMGKKNIESIPERAMDALRAYSWPGNIRELRNVVERAMIVSGGPTLEIELAGIATNAPGATASSKRLVDVERDHILAVVEAAGWRIRGSGGAAEILGLKPTTLEARMKKLGLKRPDTA